MRPARALIDLQALRHNYQLAREVTGAKALAVIKADAGRGSDHGYADHVRDIDASTPARFNAC